MSISTTTTKDSYTGNASIVTAYPITFKYLEESHVSVYFDGVLQSKGAGADYVMAGDGTAGTGEITTNVAQAGTVEVVIVLDVPFDQPVELLETGVLSSSTLEEAYDRLNMQIRRVWRKAQDVLTFSTDEAGSSTGTADTLIGFDGSGDLGEIPNSTFVESSGGIDNISDVTITAPSNGEGLVWNGSAWVNSASGNGDAFVSDPLSQFASTTSLQLKNTITDETGSGALVFATSPTLVTPALGTPSAIDLTNATNYPETNGTVQGTGATTYNIVSADEGAFASTTARGENSVDLQTDRSAADQVASGNFSALVGGRRNKVEGNQSSVLGGEDNSVTSAKSSIIGGISNSINATNPNAVILGGNSNEMTGTGGTNTILSAKDSTCTGGFYNFIVGREGHDGGFSGCKVFADSTTTPITAKADQEFAVQADNIRLDVGTPAVGQVLTCNHTDGSSEWASPAKVVYTVATLPATPAQGDVAIVTDALAPAFLSAVASGGAVVTPVFYNGSAWIVG